MENSNGKMTTTKTPMSILHEYMFSLGHVPHYQLMHDSAGHDTFFQYIVTAGDVQETGSGRSKKEARHQAAQKALDALAKADSIVRARLLLMGGITSERVASAAAGGVSSVSVSPYAEQVTENSVGALAELCAQNQLEEPIYDIIGESGPAHSKTFSMRCKVMTLMEHGTARTKKQAKHISAKRMIDKINEHLAMASSTLLTSKVQKQTEKVQFEEKNYKAAIDGYCSIKDKERGNTAGKNVSQSLSKSHLTLRELYGHQLTTLRAYALNHTSKETVEMFADAHEIPLSFSFMKSNKDGIVMCAASLATTPEVVQFGEGSDRNSSEDMASINLLRALMIMIRNSKEEE